MRHLKSFHHSLMQENESGAVSLELSFDVPRIDLDDTITSAYNVIFDHFSFNFSSEQGFPGIIRDILAEKPIETEKDLWGETVKLDLAQLMKDSIESHFGMSDLKDVEEMIPKKSRIDFSSVEDHWKESLEEFKQELIKKLAVVYRNFEGEIRDIFLDNDPSVNLKYNR